MALMQMVQGQKWLKSLDDQAALTVICQALTEKPDILVQVVEFAQQLVSLTEDMGLSSGSGSGSVGDGDSGGGGGSGSRQHLWGSKASQGGGDGDWNSGGGGWGGGGWNASGGSWGLAGNKGGGKGGKLGKKGELRLCGIIKSFNEQKGYGFIFCPEILEANNCDVFLHIQHRHRIPVGAEVSFEIGFNEKGEPQASNVMQLSSDPVFGYGAGMGMGKGGGGKKRERPVFNTEETIGDYVGTIKCYNEAQGFGFIICPDLKAQGHTDVFLHHSWYTGFAVGDDVEFTTYLNGKGQPCARDLRVPGTPAKQPRLEETTPE